MQPSWATHMHLQVDAIEHVHDRMRADARSTRMSLSEHMTTLAEMQRRVQAQERLTEPTRPPAVVGLETVARLSTDLNVLVNKLARQEAICGLPARPALRCAYTELAMADNIASLERVAAEAKSKRLGDVASSSLQCVAAGSRRGLGVSGAGDEKLNGVASCTSLASLSATGDELSSAWSGSQSGASDLFDEAEAALRAVEIADDESDEENAEDAEAKAEAERTLRRMEAKVERVAEREARARLAGSPEPCKPPPLQLPAGALLGESPEAAAAAAAAGTATSAAAAAASRRRARAEQPGSPAYYERLAGAAGSLCDRFDAAAR